MATAGGDGPGNAGTANGVDCGGGVDCWDEVVFAGDGVWFVEVGGRGEVGGGVWPSSEVTKHNSHVDAKSLAALPLAPLRIV